MNQGMQRSCYIKRLIANKGRVLGLVNSDCLRRRVLCGPVGCFNTPSLRYVVLLCGSKCFLDWGKIFYVGYVTVLLGRATW